MFNIPSYKKIKTIEILSSQKYCQGVGKGEPHILMVATQISVVNTKIVLNSKNFYVYNLHLHSKLTFKFLTLHFSQRRVLKTRKQSLPSLSAVSRGFDFKVKIFRSLQLAETIIPSNDWKTAPLNISLVNATKSMHRLHH